MKFKDFHINIKVRIIEIFISSFIGGMIFPFMAIYFAKNYGEQITGILLTVIVFIGIIINLFGGYISDLYGRKTIMVYAGIGRFIAFFIMIICNSPWFESVFITFLMMIVNIICWGVTEPAQQAMLIDVSTLEQRKLMYSITYWANNISIAIGGILGAFLFTDYLFELFIVLSFGSLITVIMIIFFIQESYFPNENEKVSPSFKMLELFKNYKVVFKDHLFIWYIIAGVLILSMEFNLTNYIAIRLSEEFINQQFIYWKIEGIQMLGFLRAENTILVALFVLFTAKFVERFKDKSVLIIGSFLFVVGYGVIAYSNNIWLLVIMMIVATVGEVIRIPVEQSNMAALPDDHNRSSYMAIKSMSTNLSFLISSIIVTFSALFPSLFIAIIITCIGIVGILIYLVIYPKIQDRVKF
ncbi:MFS transporter [Chengkuizengella axinellae]|uniref:MFS transporter n=1 Tax=Chengkuizengella axinellae TaxID=3064388 RepID=A0ABT9J680_9BACL|nr:MFS transporter [Chengkuizengella sp. 2205SS18-9]MDP5277126.1 MFS transporter [Chengkuizengella sp. 2205SS18-9]